MLISSIITHNAVENFNMERYGPNSDGSYAVLIGSIVMLVIELSLLYFAIRIALVSGKTNTTKFIHIVLAIFLTLPYLLLNMIFNKDAPAALSGSMSLTPSPTPSLRFGFI